MEFVLAHHEIRKLLFETRLAERASMLADRRRSEYFRIPLKSLNDRTDRFRRLFIKMIPGYTVDNRLSGTTFPEGKHGRSAGLSFNWRYTEVFFCSENKSSCMLKIAQENLVRLGSQQSDVRTRQS